ncbi:chitinase, partial [Streptomyces sp. SID7982]|nr:chitinase [Streptomyces sp. SID7982]
MTLLLVTGLAAAFAPAAAAAPLKAAASLCDTAPNWQAGSWYTAGTVVRFNGAYYIAEHDNPAYDPTISTWYWDPYTCGGGNPPTTGFPVSQAQFDQMFPNRNSFYTYSGLVSALSAYPAFANTGSTEVKRREAAAFLANVSHET